MTEPTTTKRYAHDVAPPPLPGDPIPQLAQARYHAARAQGFYLAGLEPWNDLRMEGIRLFILEFELAAVWAGIEDVASGAVCTSDLARKVLQRLDDPEGMGEYLWELLTDLGIDPDSIRPYGEARMPEPPPAGREYIVIPAHLVGNPASGYETTYSSDLHRSPTFKAAVEHGWKVHDHDDWLIGIVVGRTLVGFAQDHDVERTWDELVAVSAALGLDAPPDAPPSRGHSETTWTAADTLTPASAK